MAQLMDRASMPLLMVDRVLPEIGVPSVSLDNLKAGRLAAAHLIEHGFDKVGCLRGDRNSYTDQERFRGVVDELEKNGFSLNPEFVCGDGYDYESSLAEAQKLLCGRDLPDAVIALGGQGILSILETSKANLIGIPDDLSVVAFDEQPWSSFVSPPLTTISQPTEEMAKVAAESLLSLLGIRNESAESILLSASLISRHSVQSRGARK
ncbi:MAG: substrate-binding domain-containing protein [Verrucomicrobiota bacterium]